MRVPRRRVPATAGIVLLTSLALALPTALLETGTVTAAHSAAPAGDCAQPYPVASVANAKMPRRRPGESTDAVSVELRR